MRIAEINDIASVASEIAAGLRERGHEVTLLQPRLVGANLHPLVKPIIGPARAIDWLDLIHTMRRDKFDLAHIHYAYLGNVGRLGGFPYILHCHGTDMRGSTVFTRPLIRNALRGARHVFFSTPDLAHYVRPIRPDAEFLPNPIDSDTFRPECLPSQHKSVYICCALTEIKGAPRLLSACRRLAEERPDIRFTAHAGGPYTADFAALPNVTILRRQPRWKLPGIINQHGAVLGWVRLGIAGMAELEAMACGRPVITWFNQMHAYSEEPPFVTAVDGIDIANAVTNLVDNPEMRDLIGAKSRDWVRRFHSLEAATSRVEEVALAIANGQPIPKRLAPAA